MAAKRSFDERLEELQKRRDQLKAKERDLKKKKSEKERKQRTSRLIELGGIVESVLGRPTVDEDKDRFMRFLKMQERNGHYFTRAMNVSTASDESAGSAALSEEAPVS